VTKPVQETESEVVQEIVQADVQEAVQDAVEDIIVQEVTPVEPEVPVAQISESAEVIESKEIEPEVEKVDEIVEEVVKEPVVAAPVNTSNEEDEILDQLEKSIAEADTTQEVDEVRMENVSAHHTDNEEIDMDIVATGETLPDNAIIAEQEVEKSEKVDEEPNTDDFKETAAEIVDSVIDSLADFKKEHVSAAGGDELTADEVVEEKNVQKKQLEEIQKLMEEKGMGEIDTTEQAKLYLDWKCCWNCFFFLFLNRH